MSVLIKGITLDDFIRCGGEYAEYLDGTGCTVEIPDHGDLIDRDELSREMYHEAFETDSKLQKWDSGCWIRYMMFEKHRDAAPVVIPAERSEDARE